MRSVSAFWRLVRPLGDILAAITAFAAAFLVRIRLPIPLTQFLLPEDRILFFVSEWWVVVVSQVLALYFFGFYDPPRGPDQTRGLLAATSLQGIALAGFYFLTDREFPRSVLVLFVAFNVLLLLAWRSLLGGRVSRPRRRVAIVGRGPQARELAAKIRSGGFLEFVVAGHVPAPEEFSITEVDRSEGEGGAGPLGPCLGRLEDLPALLTAGEVEDVILAVETSPWQTRLLDRLAGASGARGNVLLLPGPVESLIGRMRYRWVQDVPLIDVVRQSEWRINQPVKRLLDLLGASLLLVLTLPLTAAVALAVAVTSPGPVFYRQERLGRARKPFQVWKFRTMRRDAERGTGEVLARRGDPRLTPVGALLRRYRLDELPQLINVIMGSMSLVGPRPERPGFVERYLEEVPGYAERFSVPPGLTGLAQIHGDYHSTAENKLRYDLAYIANWSPWLDLVLLVRTVKIVLTSRGV